MDVILSAIKLLERDASSKDFKDKDAKKTIARLRSTANLLEQHTIGPDDVKLLSALLRQPLVSVYHSAFLHTLDYATAVFRFIHKTRILPLSESQRPIHDWENVLVSLLSGLLDFIEDIESQNKTLYSKHGKSVASAVFPVLCPLFFRASLDQAPIVDFGGDLTLVAYQLLMNVVSMHAANATKLRDDVGGKCLGVTISYTKDFLVLESLLELFAVLIPSVQGGRERRRKFITAVFSPAIFRCSDRIVHCLESLTNPDWAVTSAAIVQALAQSDISFPQPFDISNLAVDGQLLDQASSFHIDKSQFIANLEKDGKIETFHLPFSIIRTISGSPSNNSDGFVQILIRTSEPVILGDRPMTIEPVSEMAVSFRLPQRVFKDFEQALRSRHLNITTMTTTKQSKAQEIKLDFGSTKVNSGPTLTQERVQSLSRLWANDSAPRDDANDPYATSPLTHVPGSKVVKKPSSEASSLLEVPPVPIADNLDQASDNETLRRKNRSSRMSKVIYSDEDSPTIVREDQQLISNPRAQRVIEIEKEPLDCNPTVSCSPNESSAEPPEGHFVAEMREGKQNHRTPAKGARKRRVSEVDNADNDLDEEERSGTKRLRRNTTALSPVPFPVSSRVKKYAKKSNMLPPKVDFDEVPLPEISRPVVKSSNPRSSGMKDKNRKASSKTRRVTAKASKLELEERSDPDATLIDTSPKNVLFASKSPAGGVEDTKDYKPTTRASKTTALSSKQEGQQKKGTSKRRQKAPWEDNNFLANVSESLVAPSDFSDVGLSAPGIVSHGTPEEVSEGRFSSEGDTSFAGRRSETLLLLESAQRSSPDENLKPAGPEVVTIDLTESSPAALRIKRQAVMADDEPKAKVFRKERRDHVTTQQPDCQETSFESPSKSACINRKPPSVEISTESDPSKLSNDDHRRTSKANVRAISPGLQENKQWARESPLGSQKVKERHHDEASRSDRMNNVHEDDKVFLSESPISNVKSRAKLRIATDHQQPDDSSQGAGRVKAVQKAYARPKSAYLSSRIQQERVRRGSGIEQPFVQEEPLDKIVKIFDEINKVVIDKVCRRFDHVTDELHIGQLAILEGSAGIAKEMCNDSSRHFNDMIDLESGYIGQREKISRGLQNYLKATEQLSHCFKDVIEQHDHRGLARKFPTKLFDRVPAAIKHPKLQL